MRVTTSEKMHDVVVVGSGPAGYAAAVQAAWAGLATLVLGGFESGGRLMLADRVENYPGVGDSMAGPDLADGMEEQAIHLGAEMRPENVERVGLSEQPFKLWAEGEEEPVPARMVIVATGAKARRLVIEGEQRLIGRGVSGCATCDGFFFRDRKVVVVGGGDRAMQESLFLTRYAREVVLVHRRAHFRASGTLLGRARAEPKISFLTDTVVEEVLGDFSVEGLRTRDVETDEEDVLVVDGLFAAIGYDPHLGPFEGLLETNKDGYVVFKQRTMTSVPGVFAAGEVADGRYRQTATAVGEGCKAAMDVER